MHRRLRILGRRPLGLRRIPDARVIAAARACSRAVRTSCDSWRSQTASSWSAIAFRASRELDRARLEATCVAPDDSRATPDSHGGYQCDRGGLSTGRRAAQDTSRRKRRSRAGATTSRRARRGPEPRMCDAVRPSRCRAACGSERWSREAGSTSRLASRTAREAALSVATDEAASRRLRQPGNGAVHYAPEQADRTSCSAGPEPFRAAAGSPPDPDTRPGTSSGRRPGCAPGQLEFQLAMLRSRRQRQVEPRTVVPKPRSALTRGCRPNTDTPALARASAAQRVASPTERSPCTSARERPHDAPSSRP